MYIHYVVCVYLLYHGLFISLKVNNYCMSIFCKSILSYHWNAKMNTLLHT